MSNNSKPSTSTTLPSSTLCSSSELEHGVMCCYLYAVSGLVKQDQIAPVRIFLELGRPTVHRPLPIGIAQETAASRRTSFEDVPLN